MAVIVSPSSPLSEQLSPLFWSNWASRRRFFCFIRLFWNQIFTWVSFSPSAAAISIRRARVRYLLKWNSFSSSVSCLFVKFVRPILGCGVPGVEGYPYSLVCFVTVKKGGIHETNVFFLIVCWQHGWKKLIKKSTTEEIFYIWRVICKYMCVWLLSVRENFINWINKRR